MDDLELKVFTFMKESLAIEGIFREPSRDEVEETIYFLCVELTYDRVINLQKIYAPGFPLRDRKGMDVRVGNYVAPKGNSDMPLKLKKVLFETDDPYLNHVNFELLHPFMDGNGRIGRTIWAKKMIKNKLDPFRLSFLHQFYYQCLANAE